MLKHSSTKRKRKAGAKELRNSNLCHLYLQRQLLRRTARRVNYSLDLRDRIGSAAGVAGLYRSLDCLYSTWLVVEHTRKVYEVLSAEVDIRFPRYRRSLDSRIRRNRSPAEQATYQYRAWLYSMFDRAPDSAFERLDLDPAYARDILRAVTSRSVQKLEHAEQQISEFAQRYAPVCNAYKHGRAIFAMEPFFEKGKVVLRASTTVATVLVSNKPDLPPHEFVTITADDALLGDIDLILEITATQIARLHLMVETLVGMLENVIAQLEAGTDEKTYFMLFMFGEPYSEEEQAVLEILRDGTIHLFKGEE